MKRAGTLLLLALPLVLVYASPQQNQSGAKDPGVRSSSAGAGGPVAGLSSDEMSFFTDGQARFQKVEAVSDGLGPTFNSNQCSSCHSQPAIGGTSPSQNPQVDVATLNGATNHIPFFITRDGPVREARFKFALNSDGTLSNVRDGGVHDLFTITGRSDASSCSLSQPNFEQMQDLNNLIFRIPTPVFGAGLIESIDEAAIVANMVANASDKRAVGIHGVPNRSGNDGTITRFGWKAQNKSLLMFSGEAYNVEMGVTNELFPNERGYPPSSLPPSCLFNSLPEDSTNFPPQSSQAAVPSDVVQFANFMRFLDQPAPACTGASCSASIQNGQQLFTTVVKCALCHSPTLTTPAKSSFTPAALSGVSANLFSDLLLHHMGSGLADNIVQGAAGPDQFRTSPLWGLGQRIFFLHDGRTSDLLQAIEAHASPGSEANAVVERFNGLTDQQKQDLLNFLRSL